MTKEELKEAIAATITENGQKGITGQALANLLNEIVDAAGEGGGGGSGLTLNAVIGFDEISGALLVTSEPNDTNAQVYRKIIEGAANGVGYPVTLMIDLSILEPEMFYFVNMDIMMSNNNISGLSFASTFLKLELGIQSLVLYEDGSISSEVQETSGE